MVSALIDEKLKHLEFIQGVINRMAANSFAIKGWSVTLMSAFFALSASTGNVNFTYLALVPVVIFAGLDGYFLWQEKLYRKHYDAVRQMDGAEVDFSMDVSSYKDGLEETWFFAAVSKTLVPFHGSLVAAILIVIFFVKSGSA